MRIDFKYFNDHHEEIMAFFDERPKWWGGGARIAIGDPETDHFYVRRLSATHVRIWKKTRVYEIKIPDKSTDFADLYNKLAN
jgi:hypothetical protein